MATVPNFPVGVQVRHVTVSGTVHLRKTAPTGAEVITIWTQPQRPTSEAEREVLTELVRRIGWPAAVDARVTLRSFNEAAELAVRGLLVLNTPLFVVFPGQEDEGGHYRAEELRIGGIDILAELRRRMAAGDSRVSLTFEVLDGL